jgi:hypothetical protein
MGITQRDDGKRSVAEMDVRSKLYLAGTQVTASAAELNAVADLSVNGGLQKVKVIALTAAGDTNENDTAWDLPDKAIINDVLLDVTTAETTATTKTINVGLLASESGGDADGFAVGISTAATGLVRPQATITAGGSETYFSASTRGALLATFVAGSDAATDVGTNYEFPHLSDSVTAKSVSWTAGEAQTEFAGSLIILYTEVA